ncbi:hypothetical protein FQS87_08240 [Enterococcus avium]|uniref:hypothetical protein n=1 Tax=Enterococcus TaxID=1350 RepID=UPI001A964607|nr:hypothetical protein [Enterococcus avium]MBO1139884.1 hypothetical protein [Enterococcus avium]
MRQIEKAEWIRSIENDFDLFFFGHGADGETHKVYFEPANGGAWIIEIDTFKKQISVNKPTHYISGEERKLASHHNQGRTVIMRLLENIENWNELGLDIKFKSIDEIDIWLGEKTYEWIMRFDGKEKENAFGNHDWSEF